jgi:hypothetical protein
MLPYLATIVVLALISRNPRWIRINMPASHRQAVLPRLVMTTCGYRVFFLPFPQFSQGTT